ncbi:unnamed protein product [Hyaloperonospora brassicae]|uniref:RxLR effector candidate protein n=1 Tax=Hyaloperonospora brassicae TaxID=162125 RepID=A0AAV0SZF4_HYABA|nr:unnamed protein product [Hyaloperonospora brassicae]
MLSPNLNALLGKTTQISKGPIVAESNLCGSPQYETSNVSVRAAADVANQPWYRDASSHGAAASEQIAKKGRSERNERERRDVFVEKWLSEAHL